MIIKIDLDKGLGEGDANYVTEWLFDGGFYKSEKVTIHHGERGGLAFSYHTSRAGNIFIDVRRVK